MAKEETAKAGAKTAEPEIDIAGFRVVAWDGADLLSTAEFDCDRPPDDDTGFHLVEDPDRNIKGDRVDLVTIEPIDDAGDTLLSQNFDFSFEPPGPGRPGFFRIDCEKTLCEKVDGPVDAP